MTDNPKVPDDTPDPKAFERMKEFTRKLVAVPKEEITKVKHHPPEDGRPAR